MTDATQIPEEIREALMRKLEDEFGAPASFYDFAAGAILEAVAPALMAEAEKRGRSIGTANATRRFQESLPEATRQMQEAAWDEGYDARGVDIANEGLTHQSLTLNPYRAATIRGEQA